VADDYTTAEIVRRLTSIEQTLHELSMRMVPQDAFSRAEREWERRFTELERDLDAERQARRDAVREVKAEMAGQGANWRQAVYAGAIPTLLFLVGILLQLKGGK
jgi:hypothetical protein